MSPPAPTTSFVWGRCTGWRCGLAVGLAAAATVTAAVGGANSRLPDVLDTPPLARAAAAQAATTGIAASGSTLLAVGPRGTLLRSTDNGVNWRAVALPLSADLTSVRFSSPDTAWAVGHDAVILKSSDRGETWVRVLDGRMLLKSLQQAAQGDARLARAVERTMSQSASPDVWPSALFDLMFVDAERGFAVGAFGLLLATSDGGKTWQMATDRSDNENDFHLYAIVGEGGRPYIAGEQGVLLRLDEAGHRFERVRTPYTGTYFGLATAGKTVLAYGLRGNVFLSTDAGTSWRKLETGVDANVVAGGLTTDGALWLATQGGDILTGTVADDALAVSASAPGPDLYGAVALESGRFAVARLNGVALFDARRAKGPLAGPPPGHAVNPSR